MFRLMSGWRLAGEGYALLVTPGWKRAMQKGDLGGWEVAGGLAYTFCRSEDLWQSQWGRTSDFRWPCATTSRLVYHRPAGAVGVNVDSTCKKGVIPSGLRRRPVRGLGFVGAEAVQLPPERDAGEDRKGQG